MSNQTEIHKKSEEAAAEPLRIYLTLAAFGVIYNHLINYLEDTEAHDFLVSLQVAMGVAVTLLLSVPFLGRRRAWQLFLSFVASGSPMIIGSLWRWHQRRTLAQEFFNGNHQAGKGSVHAAAQEEA